MAVQPDNKIVVATAVENITGGQDFVVQRYNPDSTLDPTFGPDRTGTVFTHVGGVNQFSAQVSAIGLQADGKIDVVGEYDLFDEATQATTQNFIVVRYNARGRLDKDFGSDGVSTVKSFVLSNDPFYSFQIPSLSLNAIAFQSNGKIVVAGTIYDPNNAGTSDLPGTGDDFFVARLLP